MCEKVDMLGVWHPLPQYVGGATPSIMVGDKTLKIIFVFVGECGKFWSVVVVTVVFCLGSVCK